MAKAVGPQGAEGLAPAYFRDWPGPLLSGITSRLTNVLGGSRDPSRNGTEKARCTRLSKTRPGPPPAGDAPTGAIPGVRNASPAQPRGCCNTPPSLRDSSGGEGARNTGEASFCSQRPSLEAGDLPGPCTRQAQACCRPGGQERSPCHSLPARHACAMNAPDGWGRGRLPTGEETLTRQTAVNSRRKEEGQGRRGRGGRGGREGASSPRIDQTPGLQSDRSARRAVTTTSPPRGFPTVSSTSRQEVWGGGSGLVFCSTGTMPGIQERMNK